MRISIDVENIVENESVSIEIEVKSLLDFPEVAASEANNVAYAEGWDVEDIRYNVSDLDEQYYETIIKILDTFVVEIVEYSDDELYDAEISDLNRTFSQKIERIFKGEILNNLEIDVALKKAITTDENGELSFVAYKFIK